MTDPQIAGVSILFGIFALIGVSLALAATTLGATQADRAKRYGRTGYLARMLLYMAVAHLGALAEFAGGHHHWVWSSRTGGIGSVLFAALVLIGYCAARRLNDAGIEKRTLAILTGLPVVGILIAFYLATLPSVLPPGEPSPGAAQ